MEPSDQTVPYPCFCLKLKRLFRHTFLSDGYFIDLSVLSRQHPRSIGGARQIRHRPIICHITEAMSRDTVPTTVNATQ